MAGGVAIAESPIPIDLKTGWAVTRAGPVICIDNSVKEFPIEVAE